LQASEDKLKQKMDTLKVESEKSEKRVVLMEKRVQDLDHDLKLHKIYKDK
jgi:hypothetical protein